MTGAQLEQAKVSADGIKRLVGFDNAAGRKSRRDRPGLGPALEMRIGVHGVSVSFTKRTASFLPETSSKATLRSAPNFGLPA